MVIKFFSTLVSVLICGLLTMGCDTHRHKYYDYTDLILDGGGEVDVIIPDGVSVRLDGEGLYKLHLYGGLLYEFYFDGEVTLIDNNTNVIMSSDDGVMFYTVDLDGDYYLLVKKEREEHKECEYEFESDD